MGKQINYYLEYDGFLKIAEAALQSGCDILKAVNGKVIRSRDLSVVTPDCDRYYFHFPPAGEVRVRTIDDGRQFVVSSYTPSGNTLIEAGYSRISEQEKTIDRARLFVISGYYDDREEWIPRPDCLTKLYSRLVRIAKKLLRAPKPGKRDPNEITVRRYADYIEYYISPYCMRLTDQSYKVH